MKKILFDKYQGNGNDFIIIDSRGLNTIDFILNEGTILIKRLCNRQFGIGADGIIFVLDPDNDNDAKMRIFNSDSSEAQMCGNGIRCLVEYLHNSNLNTDEVSINFKIETNSGLKIANYSNTGIRVKMGRPVLDNHLIPTSISNKTKSLFSTQFNQGQFSSKGYAVGMGNPHLIFFVEDLSTINVSQLGPFFENSSFFPEKTNVHFCQIINGKNIKVKVWERGSGVTLACGTGACAVHVAAYILGFCDKITNISLPGGDLVIDWDNSDKEVEMTGLATKVFNGEILI